MHFRQSAIGCEFVDSSEGNVAVVMAMTVVVVVVAVCRGGANCDEKLLIKSICVYIIYVNVNEYMEYE